MKREREKHITRLHIILFFLALIVGIGTYIGIRIGISNNKKNYVDFEKEIVKAGKIYFKINDIELDEGFEKKINIKTLDKENLLQNDLKNKCKGYDLASSERNIYTEEYEIVHRAYIKCGRRYETLYYYE